MKGENMTESSNNYLADEKIGKLILKFSIPCILSMLVSSLYNIVDQVFIGRGIGYLANGATNIVFPITVVALAVALMIGDGCAAYLSLCHGRGDKESAHRSVGNAVVSLVVSGVVLMVVFMIFKEQILKLFAATENNIG
jgi:Na+-driven multidrug efflux pump